MNLESLPAFDPLDDIGQVDLSRHALIEASAGTGKTYTLENLVLRLLKEDPDIRLENILLVTFTEKATSELKLRIRGRIQQILDQEVELEQALRHKLRESLEEFDNAAITTIHGFCHRLLAEFPFETGNLFQEEIIDDGPLLEELLRVQMREDWPRHYGQRLKTLLALSDFSADMDGFVRAAVDLAMRMSGDPSREALIPDPATMDLEKLWQAARQTLATLKTLVGTPPRFCDGYHRLNINSRSKAAIIRDLVEPVEHLLERTDVRECRLEDFKGLADTLGARHPSGDRNIDRLVPTRWLKAGENLHECPDLTTIRDRLDDLVRLLGALSHALMLKTVIQLRQDLRSLKMQNGWISYQDMLTRVADFVTGEGGSGGMSGIRSRYRVAFVDEFQDTDDVQWRIFSTLFLDGSAPGLNNRLFLIGDPKQAIYGFRGADVFTYLSARQRMKSLAENGLANLYRLTVNWRSIPDLVEAFNRLFAQEAWFGPRDRRGPFQIGYTPSESADPVQPALVSDRSGRPSFNVIDLSAAGSHAPAKELLAGFICREIRHLVGEAQIHIADRGGCARKLRFADIAVLVRSQSEFSLIEPLLRESSIPYAYYRKPGLFQCREARWLSIVLQAVCNPQRSDWVRLALLTPFFDIPSMALADGELPAGHPIQNLLAGWHAFAQKRQWGPLFQSLMEKSGLLLRHCLDPGWERSHTNFEQLFDYLEVSAYSRNLDMGGLAAFLDSLHRAHSQAGSDADIHQIETEGDKVQILTMHVSKGLEFPVVFIAGGLTMRLDGGPRTYHVADQKDPESSWKKVIDLTGGTGRQRAEREREDEDKRLYYVSLTRARIKLYVPYFSDSGNQPWRGPVCRFISQSIDGVFANTGDGPVRCGWHAVAGNALASVSSGINLATIEKRATAAGLPSDRLLPPATDFRHRNVSLESFSSIGQRLGPVDENRGRLATFTLADPVRRENDEPTAALAAEPLRSPTELGLPGGTEMGSMFHLIFEKIDFQAVIDGPADILADQTSRSVVLSAMALHRIDPRWTPQIARLVGDVLRTPVDLDGAPLVLGRLTPSRRRHEMEFYFPLAAPVPDEVPISECDRSDAACKETMIRGFIDLVFQWQGRYYIADWKSNRLEQGYGQDALTREMTTAGYELQYQLYTVAVLKWLTDQLGNRFDPSRHFGGALYFFIRGMGTGGRNGVFHATPDRLLPLKTLQKNIHDRISGQRW